MDSDTLRMFYARFKSLVSIFQQINSSFSFEKCFSARPVIPSMASLSKVIDYCTLVGLYDHGFYTLVEPPFLSSPKQGAGFLSSQSVLKLLCCDPGLVMKPIFTLFKRHHHERYPRGSSLIRRHAVAAGLLPEAASISLPGEAADLH